MVFGSEEPKPLPVTSEDAEKEICEKNIQLIINKVQE